MIPRRKAAKMRLITSSCLSFRMYQRIFMIRLFNIGKSKLNLKTRSNFTPSHTTTMDSNSKKYKSQIKIVCSVSVPETLTNRGTIREMLFKNTAKLVNICIHKYYPTRFQII
jgi:hypothetical protein